MGDERPPAEVWLDPRIEVRRSAIAGHGLFATAALEAGTLVVRLGGRLVDGAELARRIAAADADPALPYVDSIAVVGDQHLVLPPGSDAHFGNHSCDPTMWHDGPYRLVLRRPVPAGAELTLDDATSSGASGFALSCRCGAATCRREVTAEDWRSPTLRRCYEGHWSPALQERIDADARPAHRSHPA